jgi:hypothetical protein
VTTTLRTTCDPKRGGNGSGRGTRRRRNDWRRLLLSQSDLSRQLLQSSGTICPSGALECIDACPPGDPECVCFDFAYELADDGSMTITSFNTNTMCGTPPVVTQANAVDLLAQVATLG